MLGKVSAVSPVYLTEPVGMEEGADLFHNLCVKMTADRAPASFKESLQSVEEEIGRQRVERSSDHPHLPRAIDIDILLVEGTEEEWPPSRECEHASYVVYPLSDLIEPPDFVSVSSWREWRSKVPAEQILGIVDYDWPESWARISVPPRESI